MDEAPAPEPARAGESLIPDRSASRPRRRRIHPAAGLVLAVLAAGVLVPAAWWVHSQWRLGRVVLTNEGDPLRVEVLNESRDDVIAGPVVVLDRTTLELPDGDYRLRVTGSGRPGRIVRMAVNRGELLTRPLTLDDIRLLGEGATAAPGIGGLGRTTTISAQTNAVAVELTPGKFDLVEWSDTRLSRRDGATGQVIWDALAPEKPGDSHRPLHRWLVWFARGGYQARLTTPAADLDGDGIGDLVWTFYWTGGFLALSGKDGSVLWTYVAELDGPGRARPEFPVIPGPVPNLERAVQPLGRPAVVDVDRDGTPDFVATLLFHEFPDEIARRAGNPPRSTPMPPGPPFFRRVVLAVSGRSGKMAWAHSIDPRFTSMTVGNWNTGPDVARGRTSSFIGLVDGAAWRGLDPATGRVVAGPIDVGSQSAQPVRYDDLDGDGMPELIAAAPGALTAFSLPGGRKLWTVPLTTNFQVPFGMYPLQDWPLVVDLDGKGRRGLVVPEIGPLDSVNKFRGVRCLDGATGRPLWTRAMRPDTISIDGALGALEAPDLDGDGARDVIVESIFVGRHPINANQGGPDGPERVYVDALSGRDGRSLWWWAVEIPTDELTTVSPPLWWGRGRDGWPLLAVPINSSGNPFGRPGTGTESALYPPTVYTLEASTGRELHAIRGLTNARADDLDGDGLADLWGDYRQTIRAFRGQAGPRWQSLELVAPVQSLLPPTWEATGPVADVDGDGVGDTVSNNLAAPGNTPLTESGSRTAIARSGRDGRLIWKARVDARRGWFDRDVSERYSLSTLPMPAGDLDGDGVPEILVQEQPTVLPVQVVRGPATLPLSVLSGRTGRTLWAAGALPLGFEAHGYSQVNWTRPLVVEPGSPPDLFVRHASPFRTASTTPITGSNILMDRLARISGRTGRVRWDLPLVDRRYPVNLQNMPPPLIADLDGDGEVDLVFLYQDLQASSNNPPTVMKAHSLRDGRLMWSSTLEETGYNLYSLQACQAGEPRRTELLMSIQKSSAQTFDNGLRAFEGRTGKPSWSWQGGDQLQGNPGQAWFVLARQGEGKPDVVALSYQAAGGKRRIVLVDAGGRERLRRDLPTQQVGMTRAADLDGDGVDELLIWHGGRLHAYDLALRELWSQPDSSGYIAPVIPSPGRGAWVMLQSGLIVDGPTGRPLWRALHSSWWMQRFGSLLDDGKAGRAPLFLSNPLNQTSETLTALALTDGGKVARPRGEVVPPDALREDPRWTRMLPWAMPVGHDLGFKGLVVLVGLAVVNVLFPLGIIWLAARRRLWSLLTLMSLPVAAAVPLSVFQTFEPLIPAQIGTTPVPPRLVFALGTLAGVPLIALIVAAGRSMIGRRWKRLMMLIGLTFVATAAIALIWLYRDSRTMPAIEHHGRSGWPLAFVPGAFGAGLLILIAWPMERIYRWLKRPRRSGPANP